MNSIRAKMHGTTLVQKLNQGSPRPLGGIKRPEPFLGTLAPVRRASGGGEQKGTKAITRLVKYIESICAKA